MISRLSTASIAQGFKKSKSILASNTKYNPYWIALWDYPNNSNAHSISINSSNKPVVALNHNSKLTLAETDNVWANTSFAKTATFPANVGNKYFMVKDSSGNYHIGHHYYNTSLSKYVPVHTRYSSAGNRDFSTRQTTTGSAQTYINGATMGNTTGYVFFVGQDVVSSIGRQLIVRMNPGGTRSASRHFYYSSGSGDNSAQGVAEDSNGDLYVCGYSYGRVGDRYDTTILKYNSSLSLLGSIRITPSAAYYPYPNANAIIDSSGNFVFPSYWYDSTGYPRATLFSFTSGLVFNWAKYIDGAASSMTSGPVVSETNYIYFCYWVGSTLYVIAFNNSGTIQWQRVLTASTGSWNAYEIKIAGDLLYIVGQHGSSGFLLKIPKDGSGTGSVFQVSGTTFTYTATSFTTANVTNYTQASISFTDSAFNTWSDLTETVTDATSSSTWTLGT